MDPPRSLARVVALAALAGAAGPAARALADVAPPGWRPRPAPVVEGSAVLAFRARLEPALRPPERERWMPPTGSCPPPATGRHATRGLSARCSVPRGETNDRVTDRAIRWLVPHALLASGDRSRALALVELGRMSDPAHRNRARAILDSDGELDVLARRLLDSPRDGSVERVAGILAELVIAALDAGVERDRILSGLPALMRLLTDRARIPMRFRVELLRPRAPRGAARHAVHARMYETRACFEAAHERTGWVATATVGLVAQDRVVVVDVRSSDEALAECVRQTVERSRRRLPPAGTQGLATMTYGPRDDVLFLPPR